MELKKKAARPSSLFSVCIDGECYSHSMVAGGFDEMS